MPDDSENFSVLASKDSLARPGDEAASEDLTKLAQLRQWLVDLASDREAAEAENEAVVAENDDLRSQLCEAEERERELREALDVKTNESELKDLELARLRASLHGFSAPMLKSQLCADRTSLCSVSTMDDDADSLDRASLCSVSTRTASKSSGALDTAPCCSCVRELGASKEHVRRLRGLLAEAAAWLASAGAAGCELRARLDAELASRPSPAEAGRSRDTRLEVDSLSCKPVVFRALQPPSANQPRRQPPVDKPKREKVPAKHGLQRSPLSPRSPRLASRKENELVMESLHAEAPLTRRRSLPSDPTAPRPQARRCAARRLSGGAPGIGGRQRV